MILYFLVLWYLRVPAAKARRGSFSTQNCAHAHSQRRQHWYKQEIEQQSDLTQQLNSRNNPTYHVAAEGRQRLIGRCLSAYKTAQGTYKVLSGTSMALWYGLFILGTVPSGISNVYKQHVLQGADVDVTAGRLRNRSSPLTLKFSVPEMMRMLAL